MQPLIAPLYDGKTAALLEVINALMNRATEPTAPDGAQLLACQHKGADFGRIFADLLHDGVIAGTALAEVKTSAGQVLQASTGAIGGSKLSSVQTSQWA